MGEGRFDETEAGPEARTSRRLLVRGAVSGGVAAALLAAGWRVAPARALAQDASPDASPAVAAEPNAIVVLFGRPMDAAAFEEHYLGTHQALVLAIPGLQEILHGPVLGTLTGGQAEYHRLAILRFAGQAELNQALGSAEGLQAFTDVQNFATGGATAFFVRLESHAGPGGMGTPPA